MIPFRHTDERAWNAIRGLDYMRANRELYVVHVDPSAFADPDLRSSSGVSLLGFDGVARIFGLPLRVDYSLRRGEIRVRHEVEA